MHEKEDETKGEAKAGERDAQGDAENKRDRGHQARDPERPFEQPPRLGARKDSDGGSAVQGDLADEEGEGHDNREDDRKRGQSERELTLPAAPESQSPTHSLSHG
jgi:hypothetical protein